MLSHFDLIRKDAVLVAIAVSDKSEERMKDISMKLDTCHMSSCDTFSFPDDLNYRC